MKDFIKKYEIWVFLVLAPIVNTIVVYIRTQDIIPENVYNHGRFAILLLLLIAIVKYTRGNEGIKDMFRPMLNWKISSKWYILSLVFAFTIATLALIVKGLYNETGMFSYVVLQSDAMTVILAFILLIWAFCGEVVWVSYCIRELSKRMPALYASLIVGVFWTLWWIPVVHLGEGVIPDFPYLALLVGMMGTAGMCAVIYGLSKSGLCVWVLQFMLNMSLILLPISPKVGGVPTYWTFVVIYFIVMLGFMYVFKINDKFKTVKWL